jgi:hypothetical protein
MESNEPTAVAEANSNTEKSKSNPPAVITVDTSAKQDDDKELAESDNGFGQARTPKHANKTRDEEGANDSKITPDRGDHQHEEGHAQHPPYGGHRRPPFGSFPPPRPYEGRPLGGNGAFQPHEPRRPPHGHPDHHYAGGRSPMQVSPGGTTNSEYHRSGGYYATGSRPSRAEGAYPPQPHHHHPPPPGYYDQRAAYHGEYPPGRTPPGYEGHAPPAYRGQYPPAQTHHGHAHPAQQSYGSYPPPDARGNPPSWGPQPPPYHHGHPPQYPAGSIPPEHYQRPTATTHDGRYPAVQHGDNGTFSRAVSSSFDRSIKSRTSEEKPRTGTAESKNSKPMFPPPPAHAQDHEQDASMASDDASWGQLKQVHSVDDNAIRERLEKDDEEDEHDNAGNHIELNPPASNSSSLTNSPTEGLEKRHAQKAAELLAAAVAQASSLDSLSSVASAQAPMDTSNNLKAPSTERNHRAPSSPGSEASASLDLMKCSSGSSGLLHLPAHQRAVLHDGLMHDNKRNRDEERGDVNTAEAVEEGEDELRRAPSDYDELKPPHDEQPLNKRVRLEESAKAESKKGDTKLKSPLSIACSPPNSPNAVDKRRLSKRVVAANDAMAGRGQSKPDYHASPQLTEGSYFDKAPSYTYSMDSAPSLPKDGIGHRKQQSLQFLPPRPGSSSSSTLTPGPMQVDGRDHHDSQADAVVPSIPSWEINALDSFGGGSVGGGQGLVSSFSFQDVPMLAPTESNLGYLAGGEIASVGHNQGRPPSRGGSQSSHPHGGHAQSHQAPHPTIESRNQSFEGGHYHGGGSYQRTDSMDVSYTGRSGGPYQEGYKPQGHQGAFPPHAPSWGTAGSDGSHPSAYHQPGPPPGYYSQRMAPGYHPHQGPVMRNYSHDSGHTRTSPPPGPPGTHPHMHPSQRPTPSGFQPPPEFAAPQNPQMSRRPPPAVYIMSSGQSGDSPGSSGKRGNGVFSWTKDDDMRLTEVMKRYKNPRDWEPIAKEHGCGKTSKEVHERWIRYLKPGVRKGQWTDHEDAIVMEAVSTSSEQPFTRWSDLAQRLPGRVGKQIRDRWVNHLNPNINHLPFSREDDLMLWDGHKKLGKRWVEISSKLFHNSRSENHIKNRWYSASFKKFISNEFGSDAYSGIKGSKSKEDMGGSKSKKKVKQEDAATVNAL